MLRCSTVIRAASFSGSELTGELLHGSVKEYVYAPGSLALRPILDRNHAALHACIQWLAPRPLPCSMAAQGYARTSLPTSVGKQLPVVSLPTSEELCTRVMYL